jgi:hypothetical protein
MKQEREFVMNDMTQIDLQGQARKRTRKVSQNVSGDHTIGCNGNVNSPPTFESPEG